MKKKICQIVVLFAVIAVFAGSMLIENEYTGNKEIKEFTAFFSVPGNELDEGNEVKDMIADITGARCEEMWLVGQTAEEAIDSYIASGMYPDFISGNTDLYEAGALIPIDEYWDKYPNIRNYMSDEAWDRLRQDDGHIYWMPQFGVVRNEATTEVIHDGEAFWIQTRVLKWAGYPEIKTVEQYFALLEAYVEENPYMRNGEENIPFMLLCDDWRYFCLENPPQFLEGYPNDGSCMVDPETEQVLDYNVSSTAKRYFQILNEEYHKGMIAPESFTQTYDEYLEKLATGRVLGMVDQWWQFAYDVNDILGLMGDEGCSYVPLPITMDEGIQNKWHIKRGNDFDIASGISVTVSCDDVEGALQFINDLLEDEMIRLRYWGVEGVDYSIDENGVFYRTPEQRAKAADRENRVSYACIYSYFPRLEGLCEDGINAFSPEYQPGEFMEALSPEVRECFDAYGCKTYVEMLGSNEHPGPWYPMYSYSDTLTNAQEAGRVWEAMTEVKQNYLPQVIMTDDFEETWKLYMEAYKACQPEIFFDAMQKELERRISLAEET